MSAALTSSYVLSRYVIVSDSLRAGGQRSSHRVLFSTRSGKIVLVTESVLATLREGNLDVLPAPLFASLRDADLLVPSTENELHAVIGENKGAIDGNPTLYQVIQPTASCQLGCGYCGQQHTSQLLCEDHQQALLDRVREKLSTGRYGGLSIGWFGAEPLAGLPVMRTMSPRLQALAQSMGCTYSAKIVTNGLALTVGIAEELVEAHKVQSAEITLDGLAEHHDRRRHTKTGKKTFDRIFANLCAVAAREDIPLLISVRCNVDRTNADGVAPLIERLAEAKLQSRIGFYVAAIHDWGNSADKASLSHEEFAERELEWLAQMIMSGFSTTLVPPRKPVVCMSVHREAELVDAYGDTFNCSEVSYVPSYGTPNLYSIGKSKPPTAPSSERNLPQPKSARTPAQALQRFNDDILDGSQKPCASCPMLPVCGGGCPKSWLDGGVPCPSPKFNMKGRLALYYAVGRIAESKRNQAATEQPSAHA